MDAAQALEILKQYRAWHSDPTATGMPDPTQLGQAIDAAANSLPSTHHGDILNWYNIWRRHDSDDEAGPVCPSSGEIRAAIDHVINNWGGAE